jgi:hypothetical protein
MTGDAPAASVPTAQGRYFAALGRRERTGAARLRATGPPEPSQTSRTAAVSPTTTTFAGNGEKEAAEMLKDAEDRGGAARSAPGNGLPQRLVRVDFGAPKRPAVVYMATPDVIARFAAALRKWNPEYTIEVEPIENPEDLDVPPLPTRRLWT